MRSNRPDSPKPKDPEPKDPKQNGWGMTQCGDCGPEYYRVCAGCLFILQDELKELRARSAQLDELLKQQSEPESEPDPPSVLDSLDSLDPFVGHVPCHFLRNRDREIYAMDCECRSVRYGCSASGILPVKRCKFGGKSGP